ncbi:MAG: hypothetical protein OEQ25_08500 [Gammaproteobacteria bacterium]|nr:hypothetical protein [Gammaproteobacteria bacterium]MDH3507165.1 hypothetical protein [Gammaproteobacteria bacterium]
MRLHAGIFDVSHITLVDLHGDDAQGFLRRLLANDDVRVEHMALEPYNALYSRMLPHNGGVVGDLVAYRAGVPERRLIASAATRDTALVWLRGHADSLAADID